MFSKEDILKRLRAGEDAGNIANEMANAINAAMSEYRTEQEEQTKKAQFLKQREKDARAAVDSVADFIERYIPTEQKVSEADRAQMAKDLPDMIDQLIDVFTDLTKAVNTAEAANKKNKQKEVKNERSDTEIILDWLNDL